MFTANRRAPKSWPPAVHIVNAHFTVGDSGILPRPVLEADRRDDADDNGEGDEGSDSEQRR